MADIPRTINVFLRKNQVAEKITMLNGGNGSAKKLFPGYPDLWDRYKAMGIKDIRTHDWFGLSDADTNIDPKNLSQPVYSVQPSNRDKAKKLMADIANARVTFHKDLSSDEMSAANPMDPLVYKVEAVATPIYINNHYDNLGTDIEILYRLGRSLGASNKIPDPDMFAEKAFYLATWATKYEGTDLIKLRKPVTYFEVWNEPDLGDFYNGRAQDFYELYAKTAKKLKSVDASIQVGTCGVANPAANDRGYVDGLLEYCKSNNVPLDFFSWHHYCDGSSDPFDYYLLGKKVKDQLISKGFTSTKSFLTEWNITPLVDTGKVSAAQTMQTASFICSSLIYMQDAHIDKSYFYRCDAMHLGLINKEKNYTYAAKAFVAFEKMRSTPYRLDIEVPGQVGSTNPDYDYKQDTLGFVSLAGTDKPLDSKGQRKLQILISNYRIDRDYITSNKYNYKQYEIDTSSTDLDAIQKALLTGSPGSKGYLFYYNDFKSPYPSEIAKAPGFPAGGLDPQKLDYKDNKGLVLNLDIPASFGVKNFEAKFSWLSADGGIVTTLDDASLTTNATSPEKGAIIGNKLLINRPEMKEYQVLLVEINLT